MRYTTPQHLWNLSTERDGFNGMDRGQQQNLSAFCLEKRGKNNPSFKPDREKIQSQDFRSHWVCFPQGGMGAAQLMQTSFRMKNDLVWKGVTSSGPSWGGQCGCAPWQGFCMCFACVTFCCTAARQRRQALLMATARLAIASQASPPPFHHST